MPRGATPTCDCGACEKCRRRAYMREYMRARRATNPLSETEKQRARERAARWRIENPDRERANARRTGQTDARKEYMRRYRQENRARLNAADLARYHSSPEEKKKWRARRLVNEAIKRGGLDRGPCETCGLTPAEGHHDDYDRPLDVRWLCKTHHAETHRMAA